jgi:phospholipase C
MSIPFMQSKIKHVIYLMLENRSFDTVLGQIYGTNNKPPHHVPALRPRERVFYGLPEDAWVPDNAAFYTKTTGWKQLFLKKNGEGFCHTPPADPGEDFAAVKAQLYGPHGDLGDASRYMKGFYINYQTARVPPIGQNDDILYPFGLYSGKWELNVLTQLALNYGLSDMWFSSVPTQTNPNRAFSVMGSSDGRIDNNDDNTKTGYKLCGRAFSPKYTIFSLMNEKYRNDPRATIPATWKLYSQKKWDSNGLFISWTHLYDLGEAGGACEQATKGKCFTEYMFPNGMDASHIRTIDDLISDIAQGTLPSYSYVEPTFFPQTYEWQSYHPPGAPYWGEQLVRKIFNALRANRSVFEKTLFLINFDEHGGTYDHLYPPVAPPPGGPTNPAFAFDRYGVRVPAVFVSPWIKRGTVLRSDYFPENPKPALPFDHTSLLKTLCDWMGISTQSGSQFPLGSRTAVAPTFDPIFTNELNTFDSDIQVTDCSDTAESCRRIGALKRLHVDALIAEITGHAPGAPPNEEVLEKIAQSCRTDAELNDALDDLRTAHRGGVK